MSYHIAQYTNIISDLRSEIQRLKKKIADQASRQLNSDRADIRHVQGKVVSTLKHMNHICQQKLFPNFCIFTLILLTSGGPGPLQPPESGGDGPVEGAAPGCLSPTDGDQEKPDGAGKQQHGDPDRHLQTPANHCGVSVYMIYMSVSFNCKL